MSGPKATPVEAIPRMIPMSSVKKIDGISIDIGIGIFQSILGRRSRAAAAATIVNAPLRIPAPPHPATALPMMNIIEDFAAPHMRDPSSKIRKALMKTTFGQDISGDPRPGFNILTFEL